MQNWPKLVVGGRHRAAEGIGGRCQKSSVVTWLEEHLLIRREWRKAMQLDSLVHWRKGGVACGGGWNLLGKLELAD